MSLETEGEQVPSISSIFLLKSFAFWQVEVHSSVELGGVRETEWRTQLDGPKVAFSPAREYARVLAKNSKDAAT